ncbi:MAG: hypothetical protein ACR2GR_00665 [Rhodothermales bacterium]
MSEICIRVPLLQPRQTLNLEVTVDGKKRLTQYRVETFDWMEGGDSENRIERLRTFIQTYDEGWQLFHIGAPAGTLLPITFRQRS